MVIYTVLAKNRKMNKKSKKFKKIKNQRNNFWGPCQVLNNKPANELGLGKHNY